MPSQYDIKIQKDREFGFAAEKSVIAQISEHCGEHMFETPRFFIIDYWGEKCLAELKTRRCHSEQYSTTMVPDNKVDYLLEMVVEAGKRGFLFFNFTDGLFVFEITEETIKHIERGKCGGRNDRNRDEFKHSYSYIPRSLLTKIKND